MDIHDEARAERNDTVEPALALRLGRSLLAVIGFAAAHLVLYMIVGAVGIGEAMRAWDSPHPPDLGAQLNRVFMEVLGFPRIAVLNSNRLWTSPFAGWIVCGNSVLWGIVIVSVHHAYRGTTVRYRGRLRGE